MTKKVNGLIIMDGFANRSESEFNAIALAGTPYFKTLTRDYPTTEIEASGRAVGLPSGQIGNSEVGHLNMGAGRVVYQDITKIDKSIEDGDFYTNPAFVGAIKNCVEHDSVMHLVGLLSTGGVHSSINHLFALIKLCSDNKLKKVKVHCLMDGRDVPPSSGIEFLAQLEAELKRVGVGEIATVVGRYYFMDRDNRWERVKLGYDMMFDGVGDKYSTADDAIKANYANGKTDEFVAPSVINGFKGVSANDSVIFFNFRSDRAREISQAIIYPNFDKFERSGGYKKVFYVGMTQYDATFEGIHTAYAPKDIKNTLGEYLANSGLTQARVAETEKYAHVTFFFNGGVDAPNRNEERVLVPSPKVATYDMQPEMSAYEVAEKAVEQVKAGKDVVIVNFANCDMVGHTGVLDATIKAVSTVDICIKRVIDAILATGGSVCLTADHGNAEQMAYKDGSPCTSHTTFPVPFVVVGEKFKHCALKSGGSLADVAPTLLELIGIDKPKEMTGESLIIK